MYRQLFLYLAGVLAGLTAVQVLPAIRGVEVELEPAIYVLGVFLAITSPPGILMLAGSMAASILVERRSPGAARALPFLAGALAGPLILAMVAIALLSETYSP